MGLTTRDESMTSSSSSAALTSFTWKDIREHQDEASCWLVIHNDVHDVTRFLEDHPGGKEFLLEAVGEDASDDFDQLHTSEAHKLLKKYKIGRLERGSNGAGKDRDEERRDDAAAQEKEKEEPEVQKSSGEHSQMRSSKGSIMISLRRALYLVGIVTVVMMIWRRWRRGKR